MAERRQRLDAGLPYIRGAGALLCAALLAAPGAAQAAAEDGPPAALARVQGLERRLVQVARKVRECTISIENWAQGPGGALMVRGGGSGVLISARGHALTNQHVVEGAKRLVAILWDGQRLEAEVVGRDPRGDVVVIQVDRKLVRGALAYTRLEVGAERRLEPGSLVLATGNPFFLAPDGDPVLTMGVVSGLGRVSGGSMVYGSAIQHDARINPGNSGGPLWDIDGSLVGINGRISSSGATSPAGPSSTGVGYAIPVSQVKNFLDPMLEGAARVAHADEEFGVQVKSAVDEKGQTWGAEVTAVKPRSPAADARIAGMRSRGIQTGDVITRVVYKGRSQEIDSATRYTNVLSTIPAGAKITVVVRRGRQNLRFNDIQIPEAVTAGEEQNKR